MASRSATVRLRTIYDTPAGAETQVEREARLRLAGRAHLRAAVMDAPAEALARLGPIELIDPRDQDDPVGSTVRAARRGGLQWLRARSVISAREAAAGEAYLRDRLIEQGLIGGPALTANALSDRIGGGSITVRDAAEDVAGWRIVGQNRARKAALILRALGALAIVEAVAVESRTMSEAAVSLLDALELHPRTREKRAVSVLRRGLAALVEFYGA